MTTNQLIINLAETTLLVVVAAGLCVRRRAACCWSFLAYLLLVITVHSSVVLWPERFWVFSAYIVTETATVVLKFLIAIEIWLRSFYCLPRARLRVGLLLVAVLVATAVAAQMVPPDMASFGAFIGIVNPRLQAGSLALYAIILAATSWYRLPIHPLHRAILGGFAVYMSVYTFAQSYMLWPGATWFAREWGLALAGGAYCAAIAWWAWAAWGPVRIPSPIVARLQPWVRSW